ncbi:hypothetical protein [Bradyrhizobium sp. UFLA05-112]
MQGRLARYRKARESVESFERRLHELAPARITSVSCVRNVYKSSICGKNAEVRVAVDIKLPGNVSELMQIKEILFHEREAHYVFLLLVSYILKYHPTVLPVRFDVLFDRRHYAKKHLEKALERVELPVEAPEKYPGKRRSDEGLPEFFRRVWGPFLRAGLSMPHLKQLDKSLYLAIYNFRRSNCWPDDLALPNRETALKEAVRIFQEQGGQAISPDQHISVAHFLKRQTMYSSASRPRRGPPRKA